MDKVLESRPAPGAVRTKLVARTLCRLAWALALTVACGGGGPVVGTTTQAAPAAASPPAAPPAPEAAPTPDAPPPPGSAPTVPALGSTGHVAVTPPPACKDLGRSPTGSPSALFDADEQHAQGTDVSAAQGTVPWRALVAGGLDFAFARASEGTHIKDEHFPPNWAMMKACGIPRGAYHVFEPTQSAAAQVDAFLKILDGDHGDLPPVLDIEISREMVARRKNAGPFPSPAAYEQEIMAWLQAVEKQTGKRPMVYLQPWYWADYLGKSPALTEYALWAAGTAPAGRDNWGWTFWQHGVPAHWDERVWDRNYYNGLDSKLIATFRGP